MALANEIQSKATSYWNETGNMPIERMPISIVDYVIETFTDRCHFPSSYTNDKIDGILNKHTNKMAMACVDIFAKAGMEGQTNHTEQNVQRVYESAWISKSLFNGLPNFVEIINK